MVEICKCLTRDAKILVFDEPTAVLTFSEIEKLCEVIHKLKDQGVSLIYISHRLEEIFQLSEHITVLKAVSYTHLSFIISSLFPMRIVYDGWLACVPDN